MELSAQESQSEKSEGLQLIRDILILGKIRISGLAVFTGYVAIAVEGNHMHDWPMVIWCIIALLLIGMGANTLNQIIEKDKDATMFRTMKKRPLPSGRVSVFMASIISSTEILLAVAILAFIHQSWLAVLFALVTVIYYGVFYTMFLKPRHYLNIVIGGVPGSMGPLIAWAAVTNDVTWAPVWMFALIFLWTPPHVWALTIHFKDDYERAGIPMLPVVKGVEETAKQIFIYSLIMFAGSVSLPFIDDHFSDSWVYLATAIVTGIIFLVWSWRLWKHRPRPASRPLFLYSILYIGLLFVAMLVDELITL